MAVPIRFKEFILDPGIVLHEPSESPIGGWPEYANTVIRNEKTGVHKTNVNRFDAIEKVTVKLSFPNNTKLPYFNSFWRAIRGSGIGFRFRVPWDYTATQEAFATGNGALKQFQLYKTYVIPGDSGPSADVDVRPLVKPVIQAAKEKNSFQLLNADGTNRTPTNLFKIYFGVTEQTTGWTVDAKTGIVYFTTAPPNGTSIKWSGEFDIPAAFMGNTLQFEYGVSSKVPSVRLREILPAELGIVIT